MRSTKTAEEPVATPCKRDGGEDDAIKGCGGLRRRWARHDVMRTQLHGERRN
jgi:hypothetical protein